MAGARILVLILTMFGLAFLAGAFDDYRMSRPPADAQIVDGTVVDFLKRPLLGRTGSATIPLVEFIDPHTGQPRTVYELSDHMRSDDDIEQALREGRTVAVHADGTAAIVLNPGATPWGYITVGSALLAAAAAVALRQFSSRPGAVRS